MKNIIPKSKEDNTFPEIQVHQARASKNCDLPVKIVFISPNRIGIHENHHPKKLEDILISILKKGYKGPALSVMESGNMGLFEKAKNQNILLTDSPLDIGIIDGHNRLVAFKLFEILGILRHALIPVQLIPIPSDLVFTTTHLWGQKPLSIETVQSINATSGQTLSNQFPYHFRVKLRDGSSVRIREGQPDVIIDLNAMLNLADFDEQVIEANSEKISQYLPLDTLRDVLSEAGLV